MNRIGYGEQCIFSQRWQNIIFFAGGVHALNPAARSRPPPRGLLHTPESPSRGEKEISGPDIQPSQNCVKDGAHPTHGNPSKRRNGVQAPAGVVMVVENSTSPLAGEGPAEQPRHRRRPGGRQTPSRGARRRGRLAEGRGPLSRLAAHRAFRLKFPFDIML